MKTPIQPGQDTLVLRVSKWVSRPQRGYTFLGHMDVDATEQDLVDRFSEHLPCTLQMQLYDTETRIVSRTFALEVAARGPLEALADIAKTWAPVRDVSKVRSWKKRLIRFLDDECDAMLARPKMYACHGETLAFGVLQNRMYVEELSGLRRNLTEDLHRFGALMMNKPGAKWWHSDIDSEDAAVVMRAWVTELRSLVQAKLDPSGES